MDNYDPKNFENVLHFLITVNYVCRLIWFSKRSEKFNLLNHHFYLCRVDRLNCRDKVSILRYLQIQVQFMRQQHFTIWPYIKIIDKLELFHHREIYFYLNNSRKLRRQRNQLIYSLLFFVWLDLYTILDAYIVFFANIGTKTKKFCTIIYCKEISTDGVDFINCLRKMRTLLERRKSGLNKIPRRTDVQVS